MEVLIVLQGGKVDATRGRQLLGKPVRFKLNNIDNERCHFSSIISINLTGLG